MRAVRAQSAIRAWNGGSLGPRLMTSDTSALALRALDQRGAAGGDDGRPPRPWPPWRGEFTRERRTVRQREREDSLPRGVPGNSCRAATRDTSEERLNDCWVDAVKLLFLKRGDGRSDIDGGSKGGFLRRRLFRCGFEPRRSDGLDGDRACARCWSSPNAADRTSVSLSSVRPTSSPTRLRESNILPSSWLAAATKLRRRTSSTSPSRVLGGDEVVELHVAGLADAVDAPHPLFEPHQRPRDVPVHEDVRGLEVDAFVARVSRDEDLEVAARRTRPGCRRARRARPGRSSGAR